MSDFAYSQAIHQPRLLKKIGPFELNKALLTMGFGTWGALEPECERDNEDYLKDKLNKTLFVKMQAIEAKRAKDQLEEKEPEKKVSKSEKKKLDFEKKWREQENKRDDPDGSKAKAKAAKKAESYIAEERRLHEAYQILRTEADHKRKQRNEAKKMMGISIDKPTDEIKVVDDMETEDAKRDDFGIIQSTSIPLEF